MILKGFVIFAQDSLRSKKVQFSGYVEGYYAYDFGKPENQLRPDFFYSFNRHNEVNLNLAFLKAQYEDSRVRGSLALMVGTYAQYNLADEPGLLQNVMEAQVGFRPFKKHNFWIDGGIMPSHIGFESAVGVDCPTLTRSILADNSPYYEAGVSLSYTDSAEKWFVSVMYLNGWQRIQRVKANSTPAFGSILKYSFSDKGLINWSTYVGNEFPDSVAKWRFFQNFYTQWKFAERWQAILGFDIGIQQNAKGSKTFLPWYSPVLILSYQPTPKWNISARGEIYMDPHEVFIQTGFKNGFQTAGYSLNVDFSPFKNLMLRIEGRGLASKDAVFIRSGLPTAQNYFLTSAINVKF